jgi:CelD/BcsL family acetyltransferase involved in cellulose biosynthesis
VEMVTSSTCVIEGDGEQVISFKIRVATDLADFAELWPRTDHFGSAHSYAFQCADILQVWCDTIGRARGTRALFVAVLDEIGRPMLLLPLGIERHRGIRILGFLDGGVCDYNSPVLFEPTRTWDRHSIERMWEELIRALPRFDIAIFDKMPAAICGVPNPFVSLGTPFPPSGHFVNITSSWEEYAAKQLPYKRESGYQRRRLAKFGHVAFTIAETPADRQRILQAMIRQKSRRYIETRGVDGLERPGYRQYYIALTERFTWPGPVLISALEVDGKILATNWGLISNKRFVGIVMSFEAGEWKSFSPGRLLLEDLVQWTFTNGFKVFDFGIGDESYKVAYTDETLELYQANIPVTLVGKVYQGGRNAKAWRFLRRVAKSTISKILIQLVIRPLKHKLK